MGKRVCDLVISQSGTDSVSVAGSTRKRKVSVEDARKTLDEKRSRHSRSVSVVDDSSTTSSNATPLTEKELEVLGNRLREARKSVGRIRTCLSRDRTHLYNSKEEERKLRGQITSARSSTKKSRESCMNHYFRNVATRTAMFDFRRAPEAGKRKISRGKKPSSERTAKGKKQIRRRTPWPR